MVQTLLVYGTCSGWLNTGPGDRKAVTLQIELLHNRDIFFEAMVIIARDIRGSPTSNLALGVGETIPDRLAFAILIPCTLYLIGCRGDPPKKPFREAFPREC